MSALPTHPYNLAMLIKKPSDIRSSEITPKSLYLRRREFIQASAAGLVAAGFAACSEEAGAQGGGLPKLANVKKGSPLSLTSEPPNSYERHHQLQQFLRVRARRRRRSEGEFEELQAGHLEDQGRRAKWPSPPTISSKTSSSRPRSRSASTVTAASRPGRWSFRGSAFRLKDVIDRVQPTSRAKFVKFTTLVDPTRFPMQKTDLLPWPYVEGLRLDEARHPLAILAVGLYGEVLPAQNGAPIRLVVPWKYGFKGVKSIVKMEFVEKQPLNTWQVMAPTEYGFYANVNPMVDHPRWSQATERRLPGLFKSTRTLMFNGYADQVASLYSGMDLQARIFEAHHDHQGNRLRRGAHPRRGARLRVLRALLRHRPERPHRQPRRLHHRSDRHLDASRSS